MHFLQAQRNNLLTFLSKEEVHSVKFRKLNFPTTEYKPHTNIYLSNCRCPLCNRRFPNYDAACKLVLHLIVWHMFDKPYIKSPPIK